MFLGNRFNEKCEDSMEWVDLVYELSVRKQTGAGLPSDGPWQGELQRRARHVLGKGNWCEGQEWGWKLPETMLVVPEMCRAFRRARVLHLVRHPVDACLRRTHLTSRMGHPVGATTLHAAYRRLGWERDPLPRRSRRPTAK